jgi:hypothetical protein
MRKGQYGRELAFLFVICLILLLYLIYVFPEQVKPPPQKVCTFKGDIKCFSFVLQEKTSMLSLNLYQETGAPMEVNSLVCTKSKKVPSVMPPLKNTVFIPNKERSYVAGGNSGNVVNCTDEDERIPKDASVGSIYNGTIYLTYLDNSTGEMKFVSGSIFVAYEK